MSEEKFDARRKREIEAELHASRPTAVALAVVGALLTLGAGIVWLVWRSWGLP